MNSTKTKTNHYTVLMGKAIGGVAIVPFENGFKIYVAWEWVDQAEEKFFAICYSELPATNMGKLDNIIHLVADYGFDVTHLKESRDLFPLIFKK